MGSGPVLIKWQKRISIGKVLKRLPCGRWCFPSHLASCGQQAIYEGPEHSYRTPQQLLIVRKSSSCEATHPRTPPGGLLIYIVSPLYIILSFARPKEKWIPFLMSNLGFRTCQNALVFPTTA